MTALINRQVNFKEAFSTTISQVEINPLLTITEFIETTRPVLATIFNINENEIEIVEAGQHKNGNLSEEAPSLVPSSRRLYEIWGQELTNVAFYVRRKNFMYPEIERYRIQREMNEFVTHNVQSEQHIDNCPICYETTSLHRRYSCIHGVCATCFDRCQLSSIRVCSLCRSF
jgi:hypothetical protein